VAGIETLEAVSSKDSLDMLTKIFEQQPSILNDPNAYAALAKAIASYGPQAKGWLLNTFQAHLQPAGAAASTGIEPGLYERYFQPSFSDLQAEIKSEVADPARQNYFMLELSAAESTLKTNLADLEAQQVGLESGDRTLVFVLDTLADTKLSDDSVLAGLAKQVAGNGAFGVGTRRRAILLVAQFGTTDDHASLLPYLQDSNETLRAAALTALKDLYQKPSVGSSTSSGQ
jgi:HEAT repeat protein